MKQVLKAGLGAVLGFGLAVGYANAAEKVKQIGDWEIYKLVDEFDDSVYHSYLPASDGDHILYAHCFDNVARVTMRPKRAFFTSGNETVTYRIDKKVAVTKTWEVLKNRSVVTEGANAWIMLDSFYGAKTMALRVDDETYRFRVSGGDKMLEHLRKYCS